MLNWALPPIPEVAAIDFANSVAASAASLILLLIALAPAATEYPAPKEGDWTARDFRFHTGEMMAEVNFHYRTIGNPSGEPVLILHGTSGSGTAC